MEQSVIPRLRREQRTVEVMIGLYCRLRHQSAGALCPACAALRGYALMRIAACRFGALKPQCSGCAVQCFAPAKRQAIRAVMRSGGPLMLLRHPWLTLMHLLDGVRFNRGGRAGAADAAQKKGGG